LGAVVCKKKRDSEKPSYFGEFAISNLQFSTLDPKIADSRAKALESAIFGSRVENFGFRLQIRRKSYNFRLQIRRHPIIFGDPGFFLGKRPKYSRNFDV